MTTSRWLRRGATGVAVGRLGVVYFTLGVLKHLIPLAPLAKWSWQPPRGVRDLDSERRLVARVVRLRRWWGGKDRDCLQRSLLLYRELSRAGADPTLVVGFQRTDGRLRGHAWVVADGSVVGEGEPEGAAFVAAFGFGRYGAVVPGVGAQAA